MPTFERMSENFELFEDLFETNSLYGGDALKTLKNIIFPNRGILRQLLSISFRNYIKTQLMASANPKLQKPVFNLANQKLFGFLYKLQELAKMCSELLP